MRTSVDLFLRNIANNMLQEPDPPADGSQTAYASFNASFEASYENRYSL